MLFLVSFPFYLSLFPFISSLHLPFVLSIPICLSFLPLHLSISLYISISPTLFIFLFLPPFFLPFFSPPISPIFLLHSLSLYLSTYLSIYLSIYLILAVHKKSFEWYLFKALFFLWTLSKKIDINILELSLYFFVYLVIFEEVVNWSLYFLCFLLCTFLNVLIDNKLSSTVSLYRRLLEQLNLLIFVIPSNDVSMLL